MPNMMESMASGSQAALQMQQNYAAAPYVQQEAAAKAEETQLKLQQDRIKAQYAGQEAEVTLRAKQFSNIAAESGIQLNSDTKNLLKQFNDDPANAKLSNTEAASKLSRLMFSVNPAEAEKLMKVSADASVKDAQAAALKLNADLKEVGNALSTTAGQTPEQFKETVKNWTPEMKTNIEKHIPGFSKETDPAIQKAQLESLLWTQSGTTLQLKLAADAHEHKLDRESKERIATQRADSARNGRDNPEARDNNRANSVYGAGETRINNKYRNQENEAQSELTEATLDARLRRTESTMFGNQTKESKKADVRLLAATDHVREIDANRNKELLSLAKRLPAGDTKDAILEELVGSMAPDKSPVVPGKAGAAAPAASAAQPDAAPATAGAVPSNKGTKDSPLPLVAKDKMETGKFYDVKGRTLEWAGTGFKDSSASKPAVSAVETKKETPNVSTKTTIDPDAEIKAKLKKQEGEMGDARRLEYTQDVKDYISKIKSGEKSLKQTAAEEAGQKKVAEWRGAAAQKKLDEAAEVERRKTFKEDELKREQAKSKVVTSKTTDDSSLTKQLAEKKATEKEVGTFESSFLKDINKRSDIKDVGPGVVRYRGSYVKLEDVVSPSNYKMLKDRGLTSASIDDILEATIKAKKKQ